MIEIKIDEKALERLKQIPKLMMFPEIRAGVNLICMEIVRQAKQRAPVDTGRLRSSIVGGVVEQTKDRIVGLVGTNVKYARYLEEGTKKMFARPYLKPAYWDIMKTRADIIMRKCLDYAWNRNIAKGGA